MLCREKRWSAALLAPFDAIWKECNARSGLLPPGSPCGARAQLSAVASVLPVFDDDSLSVLPHRAWATPVSCEVDSGLLYQCALPTRLIRRARTLDRDSANGAKVHTSSRHPNRGPGEKVSLARVPTRPVAGPPESTLGGINPFSLAEYRKRARYCGAQTR